MRESHRLVGLGIGGLAAGLFLALGRVPTPARHQVQMRAIAFNPREFSVRLGDTVVFRNADVVRHNAVRHDDFDSGELRPGESFAWVPTDTGSFGYQCTIHPRMRGSIRVVSAAKPL